MASPADVTTVLLQRASSGDARAADALLPVVYDELCRVARHHVRRSGPQTLDTVGLVHEAYLRLVDQTAASWRDRAHFCVLASKAMRHILVDASRRRSALKRGGGLHPVTLDDDRHGAPEAGPPDRLLALDEALTALAVHDARMAQVVECRYFGGMTAPETAEALGLSLRTVERDWTRARAYLYDALHDEP
jgi:RNA polymerase sigma factor (TIGR02999 family)